MSRPVFTTVAATKVPMGTAPSHRPVRAGRWVSSTMCSYLSNEQIIDSAHKVHKAFPPFCKSIKAYDPVT